MDETIEKECEKQGLKLDLGTLTSEFEKDPKGAADNHTIETLYTIVDFHKFKELMLAYKDKDKLEAAATVSATGVVDTDEVMKQLKEDALVLVGTKDSDMWELHTKVSDQRIC